MGFTEPTAVGPSVGAPGETGYSEEAIARWVSVPLQAYSAGETIYYYVAADHIAGIASVDFSLNGGEWIRVLEPTFVPQIEAEVYVACVDTGELPNEDYEIRASVTPLVGGPRVLQGSLTDIASSDGVHSMFFSVSESETSRIVWVSEAGSDDEGDGSRDDPFRTISHAAWVGLANGEVNADLAHQEVRLQSGTYTLEGFDWPRSSLLSVGGWFTVSADDPLDPPVITGNGGISMRNLCFRDCVFDLKQMSSGRILRGREDGRLWLDRCTLQGQFNNSGAAFFLGFRHGLWNTGVLVEDVIHSPIGGNLALDCHIDGLVVDAFRATGIFNCSVRRQIRTNVEGMESAHPDVFQIWNAGGEIDNIMIWGLEATDRVYAEGLFFSGGTTVFKNMSFQDVRIDNTYNGELFIFINFLAIQPFRHVLVSDSQFTGGLLNADGTPYTSGGQFTSTSSRFRNVTRYGTESPLFPFPDGEGAGGAWPGLWPGVLPWSSPLTGMRYE